MSDKIFALPLELRTLADVFEAKNMPGPARTCRESADRIGALEAEATGMRGNQRTPGTLERCIYSSTHAYCSDDVGGFGVECSEEKCPIRTEGIGK